MWAVSYTHLHIPEDLPAHSLTRQQRHSLVQEMKNFTLEISGKRPVEEAIVTSGGVKTSEVDPKTMASRKVPGLYFAGEILDCDAYTGGFNLQIAWSTAVSYTHLDVYKRQGFERRGVRVVRLDGAYQMCSAGEMGDFVARALETRKPPKLSASQLETLTVIALALIHI